MANTSAPLSPEVIEALQQAAVEAAGHAYAPYSKFKVGAALLLADGSIVTGCNVENASYGLTICAERSAVVRAISEAGPGLRIKAIAVTNLNSAASPPCGACRQVLGEFAEPGATVFFPGTAGPEAVPLAELLPYGFELGRG
jgi:cytidine deaminase